MRFSRHIDVVGEEKTERFQLSVLTRSADKVLEVVCMKRISDRLHGRSRAHHGKRVLIQGEARRRTLIHCCYFAGSQRVYRAYGRRRRSCGKDIGLARLFVHSCCKRVCVRRISHVSSDTPGILDWGRDKPYHLIRWTYRDCYWQGVLESMA